MDFQTTMGLTCILLGVGLMKLMHDAKKVVGSPTGKKVAGHIVEHFIRNIFR